MSVTYGFKVYGKWYDIIYRLEMSESQAHICWIERSSPLFTLARLSLVWSSFVRNIAY